ncbi:MAG TPA: TIGR02391 family protein, partial [Terriglobales bacterium]|nr:TIGR02391 family protein [Terriglobales bacterium]
IDAHLSMCWDWLRQQGLIAPAPGINGSNGWMMLTPKGEKFEAGRDLERLRSAMAFPKELLHPKISDKVWKALARDDLDEAVFAAFKEVEIAVREASGFAAADIGVALMRKAFDKATGPLSDMKQPEAEREALAHLFAGAIGSYKNPHSHRTVNLTDLREAQEQVLLASHLLSIVDSRSSK